MGRIEDLAKAYQDHITVPWQRTIAGAQRVFMVVYDKELELTLRARKAVFEQATVEAGHRWLECDLTDCFARWLASDEYRDAFFEEPEDLRPKFESEFKPHVAAMIAAVLKEADDRTVVAVTGVASLFCFIHLSDVLREVERDITGRLAVFFPGHKDENNYRLLDARDGWNYLAVGITIEAGAA